MIYCIMMGVYYVCTSNLSLKKLVEIEFKMLFFNPNPMKEVASYSIA